MQLDLFGNEPALTAPSSYGKTSQEFSAPKTTPSAASLEGWQARMKPLALRAASGPVQVWYMELDGEYRGACSTHNTSESPNAVAACSSLPSLISLSSVLETEPIQQKYFLSEKACEGILRRADKRGKELPPMLRDALMSAREQASKWAKVKAATRRHPPPLMPGRRMAPGAIRLRLGCWYRR